MATTLEELYTRIYTYLCINFGEENVYKDDEFEYPEILIEPTKPYLIYLGDYKVKSKNIDHKITDVWAVLHLNKYSDERYTLTTRFIRSSKSVLEIKYGYNTSHLPREDRFRVRREPFYPCFGDLERMMGDTLPLDDRLEAKILIMSDVIKEFPSIESDSNTPYIRAYSLYEADGRSETSAIKPYIFIGNSFSYSYEGITTAKDIAKVARLVDLASTVLATRRIKVNTSEEPINLNIINVGSIRVIKETAQEFLIKTSIVVDNLIDQGLCESINGLFAKTTLTNGEFCYVSNTALYEDSDTKRRINEIKDINLLLFTLKKESQGRREVRFKVTEEFEEGDISSNLLTNDIMNKIYLLTYFKINGKTESDIFPFIVP